MDDFDFIWKAVLVFLGGFFLIRIIGRKSVAQLTVSTTIVMIAVGAIFVQPIVVDTVPKTLITIAVFIVILIGMEYLQLKSNFFEKLFHGKAKVVIENGKLNTQNLKKMRITVDKLEMQLRQSNISSIADVKIGTIEPNGQFGYELVDDAKPLTIREFKHLMGTMLTPPQGESQKPIANIFDELVNKDGSDNRLLK